MGVYVVEDGIPVTLDRRMWSFDGNVRPVAPGAVMGGDDDLSNPIAVWRSQRSVRTVVGFLARNIAQVSIHAFITQANGDRERMPSNRLLSRLLRNPSPTTTGYDFMHTLVVDVCMWDRFAAVVSGEGADLQLRRLPPDRWRFERDELDQPTAVVMADRRGKDQRFPLTELLWLDGYPLPASHDPAPMTALMDLLDAERESAQYRRDLWRSGARMPGWIERPGPSDSWTRDARDRFRAGWQAYASGGLRSGSTPILEDGMTYHELSGGITPENAQQLEARKFSIAEVAAAFFVPPVFVGVLDNANYSNVTAYREILYSDTLGTWFQQLQQAYNARLLPHPRVLGTTSAFVEFNVAEKLRMSFDEQARIFQTTTGAPIMTRNEARRRLNLPSIDGADELIVPLNVIEGGQASPTDSAPKEQ